VTTQTLDQELAALIDGDPGAASERPEPDPSDVGIDETALNGSRPEPTPGETSNEDSSVAIVTAQEFAAVEEAGAEALVGEPGQAVIPEGGDVMLYGDGGASKTTLSIDLGCHLAAGRPWLGIPVPKPVRVLLIEAEGPRPLFRRKLAGKLAAWDGPDPADRLLVLETPWAAFRFPDAEEIADLIGEREVDALIVGPLTRVGMEELGTLQQVRDFMAEVASFRARSGRRLTVLLVHHDSKTGKVSGAWEGAGDTLLHAQVHAPGKTTLTIQKARWSSRWHKQVLELAWTPGEGFEAADGAERDYAAEVAALLADRVWRTPKEIAAPESKGGIGANVETVKAVLADGPFESRTGPAAQALGRAHNATVFSLTQAQESAESPKLSGGQGRSGDSGDSPVRESPVSESPPRRHRSLTQTPESPGAAA
jgi:hypothetical protein